MAPFPHEKVAEPPNLQRIRGAISPRRDPPQKIMTPNYTES